MRSFGRLLPYLRPYRKWATLAPLLMLLEVAMDVMQPRLVQHIVDVGIARHDPAVVLRAAALMVLCAVIGLGGGALCTVTATLAAQGFGFDLRRALFAKVQSLSFADLDRLETGALITRLTNDVNQAQELVLAMLRFMVRVPALLVGSLTMAVMTSPRLALLFIPLMPLVAITLAVIVRLTYPLYGRVQERLDRLNIVLQENLAGVRVVRAFARSDHELERFAAANDAMMLQNLAVARIGSATMPLMMILLNIGVVATLWLGGVWSAQSGLEVGRIIAFVNYLVQTLMALMVVSMLLMRLSRAEASSLRITEVLDTDPSIGSVPVEPTAAGCAGRVALRNVTFRYGAPDSDPVLRDVSLSVEPGETVVILGATGSGKSSLVHLVARFYDASEGEVLIDGVDVRSVDAAGLRRTIAVALQEAVLFSGTVRDNLRFGRPEATDGEIEEAASVAQADEFIRALPEGYDTEIGQRGVNLSGGQKQRIAIARALVSDPAVLILDDSTSAVDVRTEARIRSALAEQRGRRTLIVVAQRVSAALGADRVVVLDEGRVAGVGTHAELLANSPIYREIFESQMGTESPHAA